MGDKSRLSTIQERTRSQRYDHVLAIMSLNEIAFLGGACPRHVFANGILIEELETNLCLHLHRVVSSFHLFFFLRASSWSSRIAARAFALRIYMSHHKHASYAARDVAVNACGLRSH